MTAILDADIDFDGKDVADLDVDTDLDTDRWIAAMLAGEETPVSYMDAEDREWNENIFDGEDDEDEAPAPLVAVPVKVAAAPKVRDAGACRAWAKAQNLPVGNRGVIAADIWAAYLAS